MCQFLSKIRGINWDPNLSLQIRRAFSGSLWFLWEHIERRLGVTREQVTNFWEPQFAYQLSGNGNIPSLIGFHSPSSPMSIQWNANCYFSMVFGPAWVALRCQTSICPLCHPVFHNVTHCHSFSPKFVSLFPFEVYFYSWEIIFFLLKVTLNYIYFPQCVNVKAQWNNQQAI